MIVLAVCLGISLIPQATFANNNSTLPEEIIYDIFVDRFNNGRQAASDQVDVHDPYTYNGGDIKGITDRLDTIKESGFTVISLSPIMENAPKGYHGYWIEDFYQVEEEFGSLDDLKRLVEKAHEKEMKVMLELVTNYVAKSSPLVEEGGKEDWFLENKVTPMDATSWLDDVYVLDQQNPDVQEYLIDMALYWMEETGVDGFKLHAADQADPTFIEKLAQTIKEKKNNFYLIATTLQGDTDTEKLLAIEQLDAVANEKVYQALNDVFEKPDEPVAKLFDIRKDTANLRDLLFIDNIQTARFSNNFGDHGRNAVTTWKMALAYLYLTPGVPIIYQGSEVPMYGPGFPENQYIFDSTSADPDVEKAFSRMAALRLQFTQLTYGDMELVAEDQGFSLFKRTHDDKSIYVAINNDSESRVVTIDDGIDTEFQLKGLLHDDTIRANEDGKFLIGMERESAEVFIIQPNVGFNWTFIGMVAGVFIIFIGSIIYLTRKQKKRERLSK